MFFGQLGFDVCLFTVCLYVMIYHVFGQHGFDACLRAGAGTRVRSAGPSTGCLVWKHYIYIYIYIHTCIHVYKRVIIITIIIIIIIYIYIHIYIYICIYVYMYMCMLYMYSYSSSLRGAVTTTRHIAFLSWMIPQLYSSKVASPWPGKGLAQRLAQPPLPRSKQTQKSHD